MNSHVNNPTECFNFFFTMKYPTGFYCEKCECGHQHYLFAGTIFQDNKLELYKLLLGLFLFFNANKGISAVEKSSQLDVNCKTALLLCRKCRILIAQSNSEKILDSMFYEADTAYIGSRSDEEHHQGCATEQQPFLAVLTTKKENSHPMYVKLHVIPIDNSDFMEGIINKSCVLSKDKTLNTDGKTTFSKLGDLVNLKSEKINYNDKSHKLYWLNIIIGNIKNNINGIYRGIAKRDLPLFLNEQQWRFIHRNSGHTITEKVSRYILNSSPCPRKRIISALNFAEPHFNPFC